jgi:toxin HigB-1
VIRSFRDRETEKVFRREFSRKFQGIAAIGKRKLDQVNAAAALSDLGAIPGNRLESLAGDRKGKYSIRVNDQWRICFRWVDSEAFEVEIVDYHE